MITFPNCRSSSKAIVTDIESTDFLKDADRARSFCAARSADAVRVQSLLQWTPIRPGVSTTAVMGVQILRTFISLDPTVEPIWGVVYLGDRRFPINCEEQLIAYLISRQDARPSEARKVPAVLRSTTAD